MFCTHQLIDDYSSGTIVCILCGEVSSSILIDEQQEYRSFEKERYHYQKCSNTIFGDDEFVTKSNYAIGELENECERLNLKSDCLEYAFFV